MRRSLALAVAIISLSAQASSALATQVLVNIPYSEARSLLLRKGWRPVASDAPASRCDAAAPICDRFPEAQSCAPDGATCTFRWSHGNAVSEVVTTGRDPAALHVIASRCLAGCIKSEGIPPYWPAPVLVLPPEAQTEAPRQLAGTEAARMAIPCQQNTDNGKVLVDADVLPAGQTYDIEFFEPQRREEMWSFGRCVIRLKGRHRIAD